MHLLKKELLVSIALDVQLLLIVADVQVTIATFGWVTPGIKSKSYRANFTLEAKKNYFQKEIVLAMESRIVKNSLHTSGGKKDLIFMKK